MGGSTTRPPTHTPGICLGVYVPACFSRTALSGTRSWMAEEGEGTRFLLILVISLVISFLITMRIVSNHDGHGDEL